MFADSFDVFLVKRLPNLRYIDSGRARGDVWYLINVEIPAWRFNPFFIEIDFYALAVFMAGPDFDQFSKGNAGAFPPYSEHANERCAFVVPARSGSDEQFGLIFAYASGIVTHL